MSLFKFTPQAKQNLINGVIGRSALAYSHKKPAEIEQILEEMIYWEKKRILKVESRWKRKSKVRYWEQYQQSYLSSDKQKRERLLKESITHYTKQIVGNFSPLVYHISTKAVPSFLNLLLNALSLKRLVSFRRSIINENLILSGNVSLIQKLAKKGTLVFVPTHLSNLDSILLGTALFYSGLPPVMYGAGLNLFRSKIVGFFMSHLGAYRVDRQRIHQLYKDILKEYATSSLEHGFHNLFFPGGTRSRSGTVEKKLKMGLLGTTVKAYIRNLQANKPNPNIYVIPVNLNSHLTLEAETLISDFLAMSGKSRYIIENDEFSKPQRIFTYLKSHLNLNSKSFLHYGTPLDPFGNCVDEDGRSMDRHGRHIDVSRYALKNGKCVEDVKRDENYTRELASQLLDVFHRNNRVLSTNLVAFVLYEMVLSRHPEFDIYKLHRTYSYRDPISLKELYAKLDALIPYIRRLAGQNRIIYGRYLRAMDTQDIVNEALKIFGTYHKRKIIYRKGDEVFIGDLLLLSYYHNRLVGYKLEDYMGANL